MLNRKRIIKTRMLAAGRIEDKLNFALEGERRVGIMSVFPIFTGSSFHVDGKITKRVIYASDRRSYRGPTSKTEGQRFQRRLTMSFVQFREYAELLSFIAVILGVPLGLFDFHRHAVEARENAEKERVEAAERVYQTVDQRYTEFVKLSIDHPRLDCYSIPQTGEPKPPLSEAEKVQQKILFTHLTDAFEVAFIQYHKAESNPEIQKIHSSQWAGWDTYIRKFLKRPAYLETWYEIRDEYDEGLVKFMDAKIQLQS